MHSLSSAMLQSIEDNLEPFILDTKHLSTANPQKFISKDLPNVFHKYGATKSAFRVLIDKLNATLPTAVESFLKESEDNLSKMAHHGDDIEKGMVTAIITFLEQTLWINEQDAEGYDVYDVYTLPKIILKNAQICLEWMNESLGCFSNIKDKLFDIQTPFHRQQRGFPMQDALRDIITQNDDSDDTSFRAKNLRIVKQFLYKYLHTFFDEPRLDSLLELLQSYDGKFMLMPLRGVTPAMRVTLDPFVVWIKQIPYFPVPNFGYNCGGTGYILPGGSHDESSFALIYLGGGSRFHSPSHLYDLVSSLPRCPLSYQLPPKPQLVLWESGSEGNTGILLNVVRHHTSQDFYILCCQGHAKNPEEHGVCLQHLRGNFEQLDSSTLFERQQKILLEVRTPMDIPTPNLCSDLSYLHQKFWWCL